MADKQTTDVSTAPLPSLSTEEPQGLLIAIGAFCRHRIDCHAMNAGKCSCGLLEAQEALVTGLAERDTLKAERDQLQERFTEQQAATEQTWHGLVAWRSRAEAAESQLATLQGALKAKAEAWWQKADGLKEEQLILILDDCADELNALLLHEQRAPDTKT
jgi:hypothetical protein